MTGAMGSGIAIGKTGKYKIYPLVGIVFIVAALVSMSFIIDADTSVWTPRAVHGPAGPRARASTSSR